MTSSTGELESGDPADAGVRPGDDKCLAGQGLRGYGGGLALCPGESTRAELLDHLAVVRLVKKSSQTQRDDGADIGNGGQLLHGGVHDAVQLSKIVGQCLGSGLSNMPDAQAEEESRQRGLL